MDITVDQYGNVLPMDGAPWRTQLPMLDDEQFDKLVELARAMAQRPGEDGFGIFARPTFSHAMDALVSAVQGETRKAE